MKLPKLFSRRSDRQIQQWEIEVDTQQGAYRTSSGIHNGIINTNAWTHVEGKNIGRSNETTAADQAVKEAKAVWQKKYDEGYRERLDEIDIKAFFEPMLAKKWEDYGDQTRFPVFTQPKLDGMRCIAQDDRLVSRNGKPIVSAPHILSAVRKMRGTMYSHILLDGEIYCDKLSNDFNKIMSLAKKGKPSAANLAESANTLQYWIYDCFDPRSPGMTFSERNALLKVLFNDTRSLSLRMVETAKVAALPELDTLFEKWLAEGYEGQMIRKDAIYECTRTKSLLKRKLFTDSEYEILDICAGVVNRAGVAAFAVYRLSEGKVFRSGIIGNMDYCGRLLKQKKQLIGKMGTVVYFALTPDGVPRFPKLKSIRDYE